MEMNQLEFWWNVSGSNDVSNEPSRETINHSCSSICSGSPSIFPVDSWFHLSVSFGILAVCVCLVSLVSDGVCEGGNSPPRTQLLRVLSGPDVTAPTAVSRCWLESRGVSALIWIVAQMKIILELKVLVGRMSGAKASRRLMPKGIFALQSSGIQPADAFRDTWVKRGDQVFTYTVKTENFLWPWLRARGR